MRAVVLRRHGPPDVLHVEDVPLPVPGDGQVAVRVETVGINYAEVLSRRGQYAWAPRLPYVLGMEAAGRIEALGPNVTSRSVGERVIVGSQSGAYAERIVVPQAGAMPAPEDYSVEELAAFPVNYMTAWVALMEMARLRPSDRVIVTAAAGGVGTAAVQIASRFGCEVIGLAGSDEKLSRVRELGLTATVNYREPGFPTRLAEVVGDRGVNVVLETVGGEVYRRCFDALAPFGRVVVVGYASMNLVKWNPFTWWRTWRDAPRADVQKLAVASAGILASHLGYLLADEARLGRVQGDLIDFVRSQGIRPVVGATFPFDDVAEAHRFMESRRSVGKIVLRM
ncbi:MAG: NAD(P)H-quinone oxidoreductase [Gemmatimonadota bacterium]|nr:MAG: NAD(P)H-quinone oxidoreductase [Gemmatimonadota bacterium]